MQHTNQMDMNALKDFVTKWQNFGPSHYYYYYKTVWRKKDTLKGFERQKIE